MGKLVLSRKKHQSIRIGEDIEVTIEQIRGRVVRVSVKAPASVNIKRGELKDE